MDEMKTVRFANSIRCGSRENDFFADDQRLSFELVAVKIPVLNGAPGESTYQKVVRVFNKHTKHTVYTTLMNTIYWVMPDDHEYKMAPLKEPVKLSEVQKKPKPSPRSSDHLSKEEIFGKPGKD